MVKASAVRAADLGFDSCLCCGEFSGSNHTADLKKGTPGLLCQVPGIIGSVLGLVGLVSIYSDRVRQQV